MYRTVVIDDSLRKSRYKERKRDGRIEIALFISNRSNTWITTLRFIRSIFIYSISLINLLCRFYASFNNYISIAF